MRLDINNEVTVGSTACGEPTATLFVFGTGGRREQIVAVAGGQVSLDPVHRRLVVAGEREDGPAAMIVNEWSGVCVYLDEWEATSAALIENAFLRTRRASATDLCPGTSPS